MLPVQLSDESEKIAREEVREGHFDTPESALAEALRLLQKNGRHEDDAPRERLGRKIAEQRVLPLRDGTELYGDFWPEEEPIHEFTNFLAELRSQSDLRTQRLADAWIAATALEYELPLFTNNARHFEPVKDLVLVTAPPDRSQVEG